MGIDIDVLVDREKGPAQDSQAPGLTVLSLLLGKTCQLIMRCHKRRSVIRGTLTLIAVLLITGFAWGENAPSGDPGPTSAPDFHPEGKREASVPFESIWLSDLKGQASTVQEDTLDITIHGYSGLDRNFAGETKTTRYADVTVHRIIAKGEPSYANDYIADARVIWTDSSSGSKTTGIEGTLISTRQGNTTIYHILTDNKEESVKNYSIEVELRLVTVIPPSDEINILAPSDPYSKNKLVYLP